MEESRVTREDILKFPFPYKLWVVVNLPAADFICWTFDGDGIIIYYKKLQNYLQSQQSIFVIKSSGDFIQHLIDFQFKSEELDPASVVVLYFHHPCFKRKRLDLVSQIRRKNFYNLQDAQCAELNAASALKTLDKTKAVEKNIDLCTMKFGVMTKAKMLAIQASALAAFTRENKILQEKLKINEELIRKNNSKRGRSACLARQRCIELPENIFVNPYESTLVETNATSGNGYTGFYGNHSKEQLKAFFGTELPQYDENGVLIAELTDFAGSPMQKETNVLHSENLNGLMSEANDSLLAGKDLAGTASVTFETARACEVEVASGYTSQENVTLTKNTETASSNVHNTQPILTFDLKNGSINANVQFGFSVEDYKLENPVVLDQVLDNTLPSQTTQDNQDFYDDLRATFELLQNQEF